MRTYKSLISSYSQSVRVKSSPSVRFEVNNTSPSFFSSISKTIPVKNNEKNNNFNLTENYFHSITQSTLSFPGLNSKSFFSKSSQSRFYTSNTNPSWLTVQEGNKQKKQRQRQQKQQRQQKRQEQQQPQQDYPYENYNDYLHAIARKYGVKQARAVLNKNIKEKGYQPTEKDFKAILILAKEPSFALGMLSEMQSKHEIQPSNNIYTIIIENFANSKNCVKLWQMLIKSGMEPDIPLYTTFIKILGKAGRLDVAFNIKNTMLEKNLVPSVQSFNTILNLCREAEDLTRFFQVWEEMKKYNVSMNYYVYSTVLLVLSETSREEEAIKLYENFLADGYTPSQITMMGILNACRNLNRLETAEKIYDEAKKRVLNRIKVLS
eukprot:gb/GECH01001125.1/.p1 GENE.gb/GECH01001125.1/~~gb/GECH01001125.1/.p1  ORF type:complete len:378 (+),score=71.03 gb/GECH01001125.1/:1-1134(+)